MSSFTNRVWRAAKLDAALYEEVEADHDATGQAAGVVVLSSLAAGIAMAGRGGSGFLVGILLSLAAWFVWAFLVYVIGTRLLPGSKTQATVGQLLRVVGFASSPGILRFVGIVPGLAGLIFLVTSIWSLIAMVIGVRQALDYESTWRAVGVCLIGWIVQGVFVLIFSRLW